MHYRGKRRARQQRKQAVGLAILMAAVLIAGGLAYFYMSMRASAVELDATTLCPMDGPRGHFAVIIDATDTFLPAQSKFIAKYFEELREHVPRYAQVAVYVSGDFAGGQISPRLIICNPGDGSGVSPLTGNPKKLQRRWEAEFGRPVAAAIRESISTLPGTESPLMEIIQAVTLSAFPLQPDPASREVLIIVSDMLEHSSIMSHYRGHPDFSSLRDSGVLGHLKPNLEDVEVRVLYVSRPGHEGSQRRDHVSFWESYFRHYGAEVAVVERI